MSGISVFVSLSGIGVFTLLEHGANVNIYEQGQTIAHRAASANDTLMLYIIYRSGGDFSLLNHVGETPLMIAVTSDGNLVFFY